MRIGIAYSLAPPPPIGPLDGPDDRYEEFDKPETVEAIAAAIRAAGHDVELLGDGREFLARVLADPPDFVFNIAEGDGVGRSREARVPAACEMLGIPHSGSDPLTLAASLDKDTARKLVRANSSVRCPEAWLLPPDRDRSYWSSRNSWGDGYCLLNSLYDPLLPESPIPMPPRGSPGGGWGGDRPLILKPALEGSSKGIRGRCIAATKDAAFDIYDRLLRDYDQPIVVEEFIAGDEVTVGLVRSEASRRRGGRPFESFPMRIVPKVPTEQFVYSLETKRDWENQVFYEAPPLLIQPLLEKIEAAALEVFDALDCRDFARIDFRVRDGVPYFIEANPLPGLAPGTSDLVIAAQGYGVGHGDLIRKILDAALLRVGLA